MSVVKLHNKLHEKKTSATNFGVKLLVVKNGKEWKFGIVAQETFCSGECINPGKLLLVCDPYWYCQGWDVSINFPLQGLAALCAYLIVEGRKITLSSRRKRPQEVDTLQLPYEFWRKAESGCFLGIMDSELIVSWQSWKYLYFVSSCEQWRDIKWATVSGTACFTVW